jgi:septum formation protein
MTIRLALAKARAAASAAAASGASAFILGADTAVVAGSALLGKPASQIEAARMLRALSGCTHTVLTGVAVIRLPDRAERTAVESTSVAFARLSDEEIEAYVSSGEPGDKAGGYAIQGRAARFVTRIEGCYSNVVGLPVARVYALLRELGWSESAR